MKLTSKIISIILALIMLLSLAACAEQQGDDPDKSEQAATTLGTESTESLFDDKGYIKDSIDPNLDYGEEEFNILAWEHSLPEFDIEEETGDPIENAVFVRNANTEERLGVQLEFTIIKGNSSAFKDFCQTVENSIGAGITDAYDAIGCYLRSAGVLTLKHHLVDMLDLEHLDFEKPWWSDSLLELNTINDHLYFISGDIASTLIY